MDLKVEKETENKMMGRKEILFTVSTKSKTPTVEEAKEHLCKKLNLSPDLTVIVSINPVYGSMQSNVIAHAYASKEAMGAEKKHLFARIEKKVAKAAKAQGAPAETKA